MQVKVPGGGLLTTDDNTPSSIAAAILLISPSAAAAIAADPTNAVESDTSDLIAQAQQASSGQLVTPPNY